MKVIILGGFLGSGKTTLLMQLSKYIVENSDTDSPNKVVILENEIGEIGIDDIFLRSSGLKVNDLFAGCACCTVSGELLTAARKIERDYQPDWLIVETTGLAYPKKIQDNLRDAYHYTARIAVIVDALRWKRLHLPMENLFKGQIVDSDAVLINKVDLVDEDTVCSVEADIREYQQDLNIFRVSAANRIMDNVWKGVLGE